MRRQAVFLIGSRMAAAAIQAVLFILFARDSLPAEFGHTSTILNVATLAVMLVTFATAQVVLREHAAGESQRVREATALGISTSVLIGAMSALAAVAGLAVNPLRSSLGVSGLIVLGLIFDKNAEVRTAYLVADKRRVAPAANLIERRVAAVGAYAVVADVLHVDPAVAFGMAYVVGGWVGAFESWVRTRHALRWSGLRWTSVARAARVAGPYLSNNITSQARTLDVALVSGLAGPAQAGIYAAAYRIASPMLLVTTGIATALVPHAVHMGPAKARRGAIRLSVLHGIAIAVLVPLSWLCSPLVPIILGSAYRGASSVLPALVAGMIVIGLSTLLGSVLQGQGRADYVAKVGVLFLIPLALGVIAGSVAGGAVAVAWVVAIVFAVKALLMLRTVHILAIPTPALEGVAYAPTVASKR